MGRTTNPKSKEKEPASAAAVASVEDTGAAAPPAEVVEEEYSVERVIDRRLVRFPVSPKLRFSILTILIFSSDRGKIIELSTCSNGRVTKKKIIPGSPKKTLTVHN